MEKKVCKYCGEELEENDYEKLGKDTDCCTYCDKFKKAYSGIEMRRSAYVDLSKISYLAQDGDWLEVTEWANGEGFDIRINRKDREKNYELTYDELEAIINIMHMFGHEPIIFTEKEEK